MRKLSIVPFTRREIPILKAIENGQEFSIECLISPTGIGFEGEDISILLNGENLGYRFSNGLEQGIEKSEVVLVSDVSENDISLRKYAYIALEVAIQMGKEVLCFLDLNEEEQSKLLLISKQSGAILKLCGGTTSDDIKEFKSFRLFHFDIPVIYICEEIPDCDGYDVFLLLANSLKSSGKNVLAISENKYNELFGWNILEFSTSTDVKSQIFRINWLLHELECEQHPDIILVYLPQPLMQFDDQNVFDLGATAFITTRALPGDGCIYCTHISATPGNFWVEFQESLISKFGFPIMSVHVSNRLIDSTWDDSLATLRIPEQEADKVRRAFSDIDNFSFSDLRNHNNMEALVHLIETEFFNLPYGVIL